MDRRNFLRSATAAALLPAIPGPSFAFAPAAPAVAAPVFSAHTYQWAEMIVRAHDKCNLGLLQRSLHIDASVAEALKSSLIRNGVVQSQANAYGIHRATKPLYENAFINVTDTAEKVANTVSDFLDTDDNQDTSEIEIDPENESVSNDLSSVLDSEPEVGDIADEDPDIPDQFDADSA